MNDAILFLISVLGFLFSCASGVMWYLEYYAKNQTKKYVVETEFSRINDSLLDIDRKLDDIKDDVKEIRFKLD
jgi:hypothetical protein